MIIGIDFGKRIGIAYAVGSLAMPWCVVHSIEELAVKIKEKKGTLLVVGWPKLLDGQEGSQCHKTKEMLDKLLSIIGSIEYILQDERFSSKFTHGAQDSHSAAWVLQIYLDKK